MLSQARGSLFEVEVQSIAAKRLSLIDETGFAEINANVRNTGKALVGLIRWVQRMEETTRPRDRATARLR